VLCRLQRLPRSGHELLAAARSVLKQKTLRKQAAAKPMLQCEKTDYLTIFLGFTVHKQLNNSAYPGIQPLQSTPV